MGIKIFREPELNHPDLIAAWPGIGNIGLISVDMLRAQLQAEQFAEIEPYEFFYPRRVSIRNGLLSEMDFPGCRFYFHRHEKRDIIIFIGEEQPSENGKVYAEGKKAYQMAGQVLDVAARYGCRRVYTSGAAVTLTHHDAAPRVWGVSSSREINHEILHCSNTILMGQVVGRDIGSITGLNGLLLGMAKQRGFEAVCLMGEIPDYLFNIPFPYPRARGFPAGVFHKCRR